MRELLYKNILRIPLKVVFIFAVVCASLSTAPLFSALRNHYPLGFNGINSAIRPADTLIWTQFVNYYHANRLVGSNGKNLPLNGHFNEFLTLGVFHWYSDIPFLGGTYGCSVFIPFLSYKGKFTGRNSTVSLGSNAFQLADLHLEPINIMYRYEYLNVYLAYGFYAPTGKFRIFSNANIGLGCWGHQLTLAATYFFDKAKTISASAYATYEIHSKVRGISIYPGDNLCIDWGFGKILNDTFTAGIAGYTEWQTTRDTGKDVPAGTRGETDRVYALGPEIQIAIPECNGLSGVFRFRYEWEFDVRTRPKGRAAIGLATLIF